MKEYQVQCGDIDGCAKAATPGAAFRALIKKAKAPVCFGALARFCRIDSGRTKDEAKWRYQEPGALKHAP